MLGLGLRVRVGIKSLWGVNAENLVPPTFSLTVLGCDSEDGRSNTMWSSGLILAAGRTRGTAAERTAEEGRCKRMAVRTAETIRKRWGEDFNCSVKPNQGRDYCLHEHGLLCLPHQLTFSIEAGRRCESGPGTFIFDTQQAEKIFSLIQSTIKRKTPSVASCNQNQEGEKFIVINKAHSPLPRIPDRISMDPFLENKAKVKKCASSEDIQGESIVCQSESGSAHPAPITLMPLPTVPTHSSPFGSPCSNPSDVVYANPAECIQSVSKPGATMAVYVDPASVLPLKPPASRDAPTPTPSSSTPHPCFDIDHPDSGYSEVYDKITPVQNKLAALSKAKCFAKDEPIYSEPVHKKEETSHKTDPFAHLYAQVCKTLPTSSPARSPNTTLSCTATTDQPLDDVIYESLGTI